MTIYSIIDLILSPTCVYTLIGGLLTYYVLLAVYNVSPLQPLHQFPGPKVAAMSYLYEAYFDWWLVGRYSQEIRQMHEKYGKLSLLYDQSLTPRDHMEIKPNLSHNKTGRTNNQDKSR